MERFRYLGGFAAGAIWFLFCSAVGFLALPFGRKRRWPVIFFARLFCGVLTKLVGWRTDNYNFASQRAIERLGAKKDGVLRHHALRRDGTVRDTVMYSLAAGEWPEVKTRLQYQLARPR